MSIFEVFYQPGKLFESLKDRRGAWILPLILDILLVMGVAIVTIQLVGMQTIMRQRLETMHLSPEQMETAMARSTSPAQQYSGYLGAALGVPVILLAISGMLALFAAISNKQPKFATMFSMVTLAYLPYALISGLMTTLVIVSSPDRTTLDFTNLLATNPAAFMNKTDTSAALYSLMGSFDLLSFGEVGMLSYGFAKVTKSGFASGLFAVGMIWILYIFAKMGVSVLF
jgi:hypothetical protein